ncbi:MAG: type II toxin-antitoxin system HicA family toxin [Alphaproteobacteria bacterium]|nr:type II toxin-antitoxin system HicA family toxin [Alphaproteobacteria bacterium]NDC57049.1 type II toxin-antitoxin system HicA family toxin [Alphaproteobacteria bacterium]NDG05266.1 type II toxin-antitoxin system HicA family toxin [Alphaproteobacteria bacterium]
MPIPTSSRQLLKLLEQDGWQLVHVKGSHHQFKHPTKAGRVTLPHPVKDIPKGTALSVLKQTGLRQHTKRRQ